MTHGGNNFVLWGVYQAWYTFCRNEKNVAVVHKYRHSPKGFDADPSPPQSHIIMNAKYYV
jgi:hypothetical protein